eukprot:CAMPEP_0168355874 /NCGR_PEP_ID=MMETSP0213-20121227/24827_1 /TAXON_ID=151035 /ORGANISM="Euplotes harpa, Strain FSP1.4" /LENGTH=134 /DNA_ID=CAMNT_0008368201 /DNA_START=1116 /DNA_END=1520 /DNA_ORIENTATION=-
MISESKTVKYLKTVAEPFLQSLIIEVLQKMPEEPVEELIRILSSKCEKSDSDCDLPDDARLSKHCEPLTEDEKSELIALRVRYEKVRSESQQFSTILSSPGDAHSESSSVYDYSSENSISYNGSVYDSPEKAHG